MEHLGELVGFVVRYMDDMFGIYAVSNDAEETVVSEYFGLVAVGYPLHWCSMWSQFQTRIGSWSWW